MDLRPECVPVARKLLAMDSKLCVCIWQLIRWIGLTFLVTKPCGHVICSPCVTKFMTPQDTPDPHASKEEQEAHRKVLCYVCETDITPDATIEKADGKKKSKKKDKEGIKPGMVEISSEGTGFAGGGGNVATKKGVAFQC